MANLAALRAAVFRNSRKIWGVISAPGRARVKNQKLKLPYFRLLANKGLLGNVLNNLLVIMVTLQLYLHTMQFDLFKAMNV